MIDLSKRNERRGLAFGPIVLGLGVMAMGAVCLAWGRFDPGQPVPKSFPHRTALADAAALFMIIAGAAVAWRRTGAIGGAALAGWFGLVVVVLMNGPGVVRHYRVFEPYSDAAEQLAIATAGLIVFAACGGVEARAARRVMRVGQSIFGACAVLFGLAHFFYLDLTAPLVPQWLPPSQLFWACATGAAQVAAGLAILARVQARLAAILLTVMYASFTPLVHAPMLLADPSRFGVWTENALNLALTGSAWVVADSLFEAPTIAWRARPSRAGHLERASDGGPAKGAK